ncbi:MAG: hypothetical protein IJI90_01715 [Carnobacterium sp.]|uniref:hypothetical protein n=1 Tax=Carnobacterium sp. TaxID=48221 RepID=UPI002579550D|nr:hypothetical protein [Carnobacterium sp.]MBQ6483727.1 hypothetical protein [Carnobacterium sp.]
MTQQLFAKLKMNHCLIFDDKKITQVSHFKKPTIGREIAFDSEQHLNNDEWFFIKIDEAHKSMIDEYLLNSTSTTSVNSLVKNDFSKVVTIYKVMDDGIIWQKVTTSKNLAPKYILGVAKTQLKISTTPAGLEISENVDAFYNRSSERLYFHQFARIRSLFEGIDDYYKIATDQEIADFIDLGICTLASNVSFGERNQKTLKYILDSGENLNDTTFKTKKLPKLIKDLSNNEISMDSIGQVNILSNKELTVLLTVVLSGRRYKNPVNNVLTEATHTKKVQK